MSGAPNRHVLSPVKVAFRNEDEFVVAYVAATDGSWFREIGRIRRRICDERKDLWAQFKALMREAGFYIITSVTGQEIVAHEEMPPELLEGGGREV